MYACTFFGHRDCHNSIKPQLIKILVKLVEQENVDVFYVGNQGNYDALVQSALKDLKRTYPHIKYYIVLAYMPKNNPYYIFQDYQFTILPEGIETVPRRFAISWRNKWMINRSDYVITYVIHSGGGAAKFAQIAKHMGKSVISVAD